MYVLVLNYLPTCMVRLVWSVWHLSSPDIVAEGAKVWPTRRLKQEKLGIAQTVQISDSTNKAGISAFLKATIPRQNAVLHFFRFHQTRPPTPHAREPRPMKNSKWHLRLTTTAIIVGSKKDGGTASHRPLCSKRWHRLCQARSAGFVPKPGPCLGSWLIPLGCHKSQSCVKNQRSKGYYSLSNAFR